MARRPGVTVELRDLDAAADLVDALRGIPPRTPHEAARRARLADSLAAALIVQLTRKARP